MKHLPPSRRLAILVAALGLAMLAAPAAQAFTIDDQSNTTSNGAARYNDPDQQFSGSGNGQSTYRQGNATFNFGQPQSFDQRYNPNRMFQPNPRPGDDR